MKWKYIKDMAIGEEFYLDCSKDSYKAIKKSSRTIRIVNSSSSIIFYFGVADIGYFAR